MTALKQPQVERSAWIRCWYRTPTGHHTGCKLYFQVSGRSARSIRAGQRKARCAQCCVHDRINAVKPLPEHVEWWLNSYRWEEMVEIAELLWGPRERWAPRAG